ncbi:PQQ-dependent sugar dehydrogenase [Flavobacterium sp. MAH-1]|uniref:PQQ-dependent sugar dehydrogenase n=1 Tax=Flavobacterium agri TaxID=2743471 RepID=A0A7Y8Y307_9FLAO|nr:PQQ-dependent sugar dehydrogenase [Flavobacterium agri]NUY80300.1 PQQ-dependent sugar dehydrogenase [Flavobacterium agri]NYA70325.1 PQQ-dependent sugar dehydrogenase [Flavobacterium agri]
MKTLLSTMLLMLGISVLGQTIGLTTVASGFSGPIAIENAGDSRLFVVQQGGAIRILNPATGTINATNFLTLTTATIATGGERGLLGLAFHPNYASNGYFYVYYTRTGDGALVVSRYSVSANPDVADASSGFPIISVLHPTNSNHNGGSLRFGPDGYLYIGMGDGGGGGDTPNNAQTLTQNLGKMLRIDVDSASPYGIPATNPFVGIAGNDEIFYVGVRNPWKWSFDKENGDLWIADVGQNAIEEVNHLVSPLTPGQNLGWRCYEGNVPYNTSGCQPASNYVMPLAQYTHDDTNGCSVTGGYVYRGSQYPNFIGKYFFADYCISELATINAGGSTITWTNNLNFAGSITTFGQGMNGELYVNGGGTIYRIIDTSLGADDFARNGMRLYPNPSEGEVFLDAPNLPYPAQFKVYENTGKIVVDERIENTLGGHFTTGDLARGVYMVMLEDSQGNMYRTKLAIE